MIFIALLIATTQLFGSAQLPIIKAELPGPIVQATFRSMIMRASAIATEINDDNGLTGDINAPSQAIVATNYLSYLNDHSTMTTDAKPLVAAINNDPRVQSLWAIVERTQGKSLAARTHAMSVFWTETSLPLRYAAKEAIPGLQGTPHMVAVMLQNQELSLTDVQKRFWNACFATTVSIMQTIRNKDATAFSELFKMDIPKGSCAVQ